MIGALGGRRGVLGVLPALDTTFKLGEASVYVTHVSVYVTHVSVYVTHGSCKRGDLPPQDAREGEGHRDVDRCEREQVRHTKPVQHLGLERNINMRTTVSPSALDTGT